MANEFKVKKGLIVEGSGSVVLDIQGSQGQLFSITDDLTGDIFSVSDISGVPILNVNADGTTTIDGPLTLTNDETLDSTSDTSIKFLTRDSNGVVKYHSLGSNAFNSNTYNNYSLPLGTSSARGGFKIGYSENGKYYPVELSSEKMYVNVPWTDTNTNTTYTAGGGLTLTGTAFSHTDASSQSSVNGSGRTYIQDVTLDTYGHVTGLATATETVVNTNTQLTDDQVRSKFTGGTNVSITAAGVISSTDTNTDTNTVTSVRRDNTGTYRTGNINLVGGTNVSISEGSAGVFTITSTDTNTDTNTTYSAGGGLTLSGTTFSHTDTSARSSINGSGRTYIQDITLDTYGHVTALATATETVVNTDTNTQLTDDQVRSKFTGGTNVSITAAGVISSTDTNTQVTNNNQISNGAGYRTSAQVDAAIATVVDSAPAALNTLNELAAALGDDADFAGSVTTSLSGKLSTTGTAANSTLLGGIGLGAAARNDVANKVVRTDGNGYANFGWINTTSGTASGTLTRIYCSQDGYLRYLSPSSFLSSMGIAAGATNVTNNSQIGNGRGYITSFTDTNTQLSDTYVIGLFTGGSNVSIASDGTISSTDTNTDTNTTYSAGTNMTLTGTTFSSTDTNTVYTHPTTAGNKHIPTGGSDGQFLKYSASGTAVWAADNNTNTQLSTADVRGKFSAGTNVSITNGVISSTDTNTDTNTVTSVRRDNTGTYRTGNINLVGGTNVTISEGSAGVFTITSTDTNTDTNTQRAAGGGLTLSGNTLSHTDTSSQSSVNGSGRTYIQDITLDTYGHVTALATATETVVNTDTNTTYSAGTNMTLTGTTFSSTDTNTVYTHPTSAGNKHIPTGGSAGQFLKYSASGTAVWAADNNTNTQLSDSQVRSKFTGGTNVSITAGGVISSTDTNTDTNTQLSTAQVRGMFSGNGINTSTGVITDTNTDTNTQLSDTYVIGLFTGGSNVSIASDGTISSTDTNTVYTHPTGAGNTHIPTGGATGQFLRYSSSGVASWSADNNTTYTADGNYGMTLSGTTFRLENDRRRNSTSTDIYTGNTHDFTWYDADVGIRWYTAGGEDMRLLDNGTLHVDGDVVAYSSTISDERLKDNIKTIENPLDKIKALRGVEYDWNNGNRKGKHDLGLIAQEVESVIPDIVHEHTLPYVEGEEDTLYKTVDYEKMVAVLIEGMKEQQIQIDSMKSEINELKGRL